MTKRLRISRKDLQLVDEMIAAKKKIQAIKHVRSLTDESLRLAKWAVDHRCRLLEGVSIQSEAILFTPWVVKSLIVSSPEGEQLELDLEELEFKFLQEGTRITMDEVAALLDLTQFIKKWHQEAYVTREEEKNDI
tara:strand:+ start:138 stop:542 length:405 start_codon:yes stop_codon:yes gene_type:complete